MIGWLSNGCLLSQLTAANRVGQGLPESPSVDHLPNCINTCKHSSAVQKMQVFHRLGFRPQQRRYCTIVAGRNFTPREFFPRKFGEAAGHLRWANRTKHAINEEFFSAGPLLLHLLWKTLWNSCGIGENQKARVCCALMSSYNTPRHRILRVSKELAKFARYRNGRKTGSRT